MVGLIDRWMDRWIDGWMVRISKSLNTQIIPMSSKTTSDVSLSKRHGTALPGCSLSNLVALSLVSHVPAPCKITGPLLGLITIASFAMMNSAGPVINSNTAGFSGTGISAKGSPYFSHLACKQGWHPDQLPPELERQLPLNDIPSPGRTVAR